MAMSGVKLDDECVKQFEAMKLHKTKDRYTRMVIDNGLVKIELDPDTKKPMKGDCCYQELVDNLPKEEGRYIFYDYDAPQQCDGVGGGRQLIFIAWVPDASPIRQKMLYGSSTEMVKQKLNGLTASIQACDLSDVCCEEVDKKFTK